MDEHPTLSAEVRAALPAVVVAYLAYQERQIALLRERVGSLEGELAQLRLAFAKVQARTKLHSGNSSRPSSSDPPGAPPRPKRKPSGRKRGGQKGHPGHARIQLGADQITAQAEHRPVQYPGCTLPLDATLPTEGEPICVQVWEIPPITAEVTEHRGYRVRCPHCAALAPPPDLPEGAFGPRLTAMGSLLHGRFRLSMRDTTEVFADLFGVPLGPGSVSTLCQEVPTALDEPYEQVRAHVETETHANVDETGWKQAGERRWLWVAVTALCTHFLVAKNRSAAVLVSLLGETFDGVVGSDRYKAYLSIPIERRQVCWAHLKRNLVAFAERGGEIGDWGTEAVGVVEKVFAAWYRYKDGESNRAQLQEEVAGLTSNAAERALRPAVLWRKGCFGADSGAGNTFVAKILTASATCRQQERQLLTYLTNAVIAYRGGRQAPSLLPA